MWTNALFLSLVLLCVILIRRVIYQARRLDLRQRVFQLLELAVRRGLPLHRMLTLGSRGLSRFHRRRMLALARELESGEELGEALALVDSAVFPLECRAQVAAAEGGADLQVACTQQGLDARSGIATQGRWMLRFGYAIFLLGGLGATMFINLRMNGAMAGVVASVAVQSRAGYVASGDPLLGEGFRVADGLQAPRASLIDPANWLAGEAGLGMLLAALAVLVVLGGWIAHRVPILRHALRDGLARLPGWSRALRLRRQAAALRALALALGRGVGLSSSLRLAGAAAVAGRIRSGLEGAAQRLDEGECFSAEICGQLPLRERSRAVLLCTAQAPRAQQSEALNQEALACEQAVDQLQERVQSLCLWPVLLLVAVATGDQLRFMFETFHYINTMHQRALW